MNSHSESFSPPPDGGTFELQETLKVDHHPAMPGMVYNWDEKTVRNATHEERYPAVRILGGVA